MKRVAVLAVQGAFAEHERALGKVGCACVELRQASDLDQPFDALVLPGGESTAQAKMIRELGMLAGLRDRIASGMPVLGTCAGLILLARTVEEGVPAPGDPQAPVAAGAIAPGVIGTLGVTIQRNAYGRQLGSFRVVAPCRGLAGHDAAYAFGNAGIEEEAGGVGDAAATNSGLTAISIPMTFIRAPYIKEAHAGTEVLAEVEGRIVAVRSGNQIGVAFHPELDDDLHIHSLLADLA